MLSPDSLLPFWLRIQVFLWAKKFQRIYVKWLCDKISIYKREANNLHFVLGVNIINNVIYIFLNNINYIYFLLFFSENYYENEDEKKGGKN